MIVIFRGLGPGGGVWAEMDEIYDLQVIYYSIKKITLFSHTYAGQNMSILHFFITKCMNFHEIVITESVHFFYLSVNEIQTF